MFIEEEEKALKQKPLFDCYDYRLENIQTRDTDWKNHTNLPVQLSERLAFPGINGSPI